MISTSLIEIQNDFIIPSLLIIPSKVVNGSSTALKLNEVSIEFKRNFQQHKYLIFLYIYFVLIDHAIALQNFICDCRFVDELYRVLTDTDLIEFAKRYKGGLMFR